MNDLPVACDLGVFDGEEKRRQRTTLETVRAGVREVEELADGYAFKFDKDPAMLVALAQFIALESRCCAFLNFQLDVKAGASEVALRLTGGDGAKEFLRTEILDERNDARSRKLPVFERRKPHGD